MWDFQDTRRLVRSWPEGLILILGEEAFGFGEQGSSRAMGNSDLSEDGRQLPVRMKVPGAQRNGAAVVTHQMAGRRPNAGEPGGHLLGVPDRG